MKHIKFTCEDNSSKVLIGYRFVASYSNGEYDEWGEVYPLESPVVLSKEQAEFSFQRTKEQVLNQLTCTWKRQLLDMIKSHCTHSCIIERYFDYKDKYGRIQSELEDSVKYEPVYLYLRVPRTIQSKFYDLDRI